MRTRDLIGTNLLITQTEKQTFNIDTVLLANFITIPKGTNVVYDLGTGIGALLLYVSKKTTAQIIGVEIQEDRYNLAKKNVQDNHLNGQISVLNQDVLKLVASDVDVVISNPPFFKVSINANVNDDYGEAVARHEILLTLEDLIMKTSEMIKYGGIFYLIHRPDRLEEIMILFQKYQFTIKRLQFVHANSQKNANHVLIEAKKNGKFGMNVVPPLYIYNIDQTLSTEMKKVYKGGV